MRPAEPPFDVAAWRAELHLEYERRPEKGGRTVLAARRHDGPLLVQKPLYPEGDEVCHSILVHPPAGIAGGDQLAVDARLGERAHALLTTPGAGKWYRSAGAWAQQNIVFDVEKDACLEWLPQETIIFDGALADLSTQIQLAAGASYIGWEVLCLGRTGSGERFTRGECRLHTRIVRDGQPLWLERGRIEAGGRLAQSPAGLGGRSVCGTLLAAATTIGDDVLEACRALKASAGDTAVTRLPGLLVARYLGDSSEAARHYFVAIWSCVRSAISGRAAVEPRIWRT